MKRARDSLLAVLFVEDLHVDTLFDQYFVRLTVFLLFFVAVLGLSCLRGTFGPWLPIV